MNFIDNYSFSLSQVLQEGYGELTVSRRPSDKKSAKPENYLPCVNCKAWIFRKNLSAHSKSCPAGKPFDKNFLRNSEMLVSPFINVTDRDSTALVACWCFLIAFNSYTYKGNKNCYYAVIL